LKKDQKKYNKKKKKYSFEPEKRFCGKCDFYLKAQIEAFCEEKYHIR